MRDAWVQNAHYMNSHRKYIVIPSNAGRLGSKRTLHEQLPEVIPSNARRLGSKRTLHEQLPEVILCNARRQNAHYMNSYRK